MRVWWGQNRSFAPNEKYQKLIVSHEISIPKLFSAPPSTPKEAEVQKRNKKLICVNYETDTRRSAFYI